MALYEKILRELFQDFSFFAVDSNSKEKVYLSFEEINDPKGMSGPLNLFVAESMVVLGLTTSLVSAMDDLGIAITKDPKTMSGVSIKPGKSNVPNSLRTMIFAHALFSQLGSEYENETPLPGADIDVTGLFVKGRDLVDVYFNQLSIILSATPEQKQALTELAEDGNEQAKAIIEEIKRKSPEKEDEPTLGTEKQTPSDNATMTDDVLPQHDNDDPIQSHEPELGSTPPLNKRKKIKKPGA